MAAFLFFSSFFPLKDRIRIADEELVQLQAIKCFYPIIVSSQLFILAPKISQKGNTEVCVTSGTRQK